MNGQGGDYSSPRSSRPPIQLQPIIRNYALVLTAVSVGLYKVILFRESLEINYFSARDWFWLPSLMLQDVFVVWFLAWMTSSYSNGANGNDDRNNKLHKRRDQCRYVAFVLLVVTALVTSLLASAELVALFIRGMLIPWDLTAFAVQNWSIYKDLMAIEMDKDGFGFFQAFRYILICSGFITVIVRKCNNYRTRRRMEQNKVETHKNTHALTITSSFLSRCCPCNRWLVGVGYCLLVIHSRPAVPYNRLDRTLVYSVLYKINMGYIELQQRTSTVGDNTDQLESVDMTQLHHASRGESDGDSPNVVIILLESMRKDFMPFNGSAPWGTKYVTDKSMWDQITPFYDNWVQQNETVYFPQVTAASSVTHKSLLSLMCSQHALPIDMTPEIQKKLVHACLPHILIGRGYSAKVFKGMTRNFDGQIELSRLIGFPSIYGLEDRLEDAATSEQKRKKFRKRHATGWESMEDNMFLEPMLNWVDEQTSPVFLTYMTSVTHGPQIIPKNEWTPRQFSEVQDVNGLLNCISYTDKFVEMLIQEFEKRDKFTNNTLFVIMGDHGTDYHDHGKVSAYKVMTEVAYDVGISLHSKNKRLQDVLFSKAKAQTTTNGNSWSTLDVTPTILELLDIPFKSPLDNLEESKNNDIDVDNSSKAFPVDGRSMLHPSGNRLSLSIANTGFGLVLREGPFILAQSKGRETAPTIYDLDLDPLQMNPFVFSPAAKKLIIYPEQNGDISIDKAHEENLNEWANKALLFVNAIRKDLGEQFDKGMRCTNCTLAKLLTLESLHQWDANITL